MKNKNYYGLIAQVGELSGASMFEIQPKEFIEQKIKNILFYVVQISIEEKIKIKQYKIKQDNFDSFHNLIIFASEIFGNQRMKIYDLKGTLNSFINCLWNISNSYKLDFDKIIDLNLKQINEFKNKKRKNFKNI